jgi:hypothetical protein
MSQKYVTAKILAARYGVSTATITTWRRRQRIPYLKMGYRTVRFDPLACDAALELELKIPRWLRIRGIRPGQ